MPRLKPELQSALPPAPIDADVIEVEHTSVETTLVPFPGAPPPALAEHLSMGAVFAKSGFFADAKTAAQAVVKILAGRDLGIPPTIAMTAIYIVQGRITLSASLMAALVRRSDRYDYHVKTLTDTACEIEFTHREKVCGTSTFTLKDAEKAGVAHGANWKKYPRNMLFARALSNGVRWFCPDLTGCPAYTPEEVSEAASGTALAGLAIAAASVLPDPL